MVIKVKVPALFTSKKKKECKNISLLEKLFITLFNILSFLLQYIDFKAKVTIFIGY